MERQRGLRATWIVAILCLLAIQAPVATIAAADADAAPPPPQQQHQPGAADPYPPRRQLQPIYRQSAPIYNEAQAASQVRVAAVPRPQQVRYPPPQQQSRYGSYNWNDNGWNGRRLRAAAPPPLLGRRMLYAQQARGRCVCAFDFDFTLRTERDGRQDVPAADAAGIVSDCKVRSRVRGWGAALGGGGGRGACCS
jgi:hypothetical protein